MAIPDPPKRRDRKALLYVEELKHHILADPSIPARDESAAELYATALVVAAFFGEQERQLFREIYSAYTAGECLFEMREACACEGHDQLCLILDRIVAETDDVQRLARYMMEIIEAGRWRPVQKELESRGFTASNFVWWSFDPNRS